jgi:hypothetical protein
MDIFINMKRIYRLLILVILGLMLSGTSWGQNIFQDLGTFTHQYGPDTKIHLNFYVLKNLNTNGNYPMYRYEYTLVGVSSSQNVGVLTSTWLYQARIYVNGNEVSYPQSPNGFTAYIRTTQTVLYHWYTSDEYINYTIKWGDSAYDPRNIR